MIERVQTEGQITDIQLAAGAATHAGGRPGNEDRVYVAELAPNAQSSAAPLGFLLAVADGMGGHERGEVASQLAIDMVVETVGRDPGPDPALVLKQAFRKANEAIYEDGQAAGADETMGTTLVAALLRGKYATIASVGDSRAYLVRANALTQITKDHSLVAEQVANGTLSPAQARQSPRRNILTHALGHQPKLDTRLPEIFELVLLPQDRLLLCTDGFYDVMEDRELVQTVLDLDPEAAARRLVDLAVEHGTSDNISAVVAEAIPTRVPAVDLEEVAAAGRGGISGQLVAIIVAAVILVAIAVLLFTMGVV